MNRVKGYEMPESITVKDVEEHLKYLERTRQYFVHSADIEQKEGYIHFKGVIGRKTLDCYLWNESDMFRKLVG